MITNLAAIHDINVGGFTRELPGGGDYQAVGVQLWKSYFGLETHWDVPGWQNKLPLSSIDIM